MNRSLRTRALLFAAASALASTVVLIALPASAVSTRHFTLDDAGDFNRGELDGAMVRSDGAVVPGVTTTRLGLGDEALAYATVRGDDGSVYVGTGGEGKIYRLRGGEVAPFADTGQLLVSSLAIDGDTLYAGTLPEGRIYTVALADGAVEELVQLPDTEHVWALVHDGRRLYAGTGPEGKLFAIEPGGQANVVYDASQGHIMALALDGEDLYAGTDGEAIVYRVRGTDVSVVYDFPGNEVTALDAAGGVLAVAANDMPTPRPVTKSKNRSKRRTVGKGRLYRVSAEGRAERLHGDDDEHFTAVQIVGEQIYVGTGKEGRIHRVGFDRRRATYVDVDERQVTALALDGDAPVFVTGDSAAIYRVGEATGDAATWTSKALDAGFVARWGRLEWRGDGRIAVRTRSGNSEEPDETWTDWSAPMQSTGPIRSPAARFLQIRAELTRGSVLRATQAFYLPQNQRAALTKVSVDDRGSDPDSPPSPSQRLKIEWSVTNPDNDALRYRLRYRQEGQERWRPMFEEDVEVTGDHYTWDTSGIPDGWYVVQVEASDEEDNPGALTLRDLGTSEPFLVDDHDPTVEVQLRGGRLVGTARDAMGPIAKLEFAVDGGDWRLFFPEDQLLDEAEERFDLDLAELASGTHVLAVRATDAAGNSAVAEVEGQAGAEPANP